MTDAMPFWKTKTLDQMTQAEWESLCDGCGRCCLHKLEDEDTGEIAFTNVACRLLDPAQGSCRDYACRKDTVPDCVQLTPRNVGTMSWMPPSCAYRLLAHGEELPSWHHLMCGDRDEVHRAGASIRGRPIISERDAGPLDQHLVDWPGLMPTCRR